MPAHVRSLSTGDWAVLARLGEGPAHGFKVVAVFAKGGEPGSVWALQRPQVYRAIEHLRDSCSELLLKCLHRGPASPLFGSVGLTRRNSCVEGLERRTSRTACLVLDPTDPYRTRKLLGLSSPGGYDVTYGEVCKAFLIHEGKVGLADMCEADF